MFCCFDLSFSFLLFCLKFGGVLGELLPSQSGFGYTNAVLAKSETTASKQQFGTKSQCLLRLIDSRASTPVVKMAMLENKQAALFSHPRIRTAELIVTSFSLCAFPFRGRFTLCSFENVPHLSKGKNRG